MEFVQEVIKASNDRHIRFTTTGDAANTGSACSCSVLPEHDLPPGILQNGPGNATPADMVAGRRIGRTGCASAAPQLCRNGGMGMGML